MEERKNRAIFYECLCDCGNTTVVEGSKIRSGHTKTCGCLHKEKFTNRTHGESGTPLYIKHQSIIQRCTNPNTSEFHRYGGIGIGVCEEWMDYLVFKEWALSNGYEEHLSIERIDNKKGYSPHNCKFANAEEQGNNKSDNVYIEINGVTKTLSQWCKIYDLFPKTVHSRRRKNKSISLEKLFAKTPKNWNDHIKDREKANKSKRDKRRAKLDGH